MNLNYDCLGRSHLAPPKIDFGDEFESPPKTSKQVISRWLSFMMLMLIFGSVDFASAQVSDYIFSQSTGSYSPITDGVVLGSETIDEQLFNNSTVGATGVQTNTGFPIGFNFEYRGVSFDKFAVATNGYLVLGTGSFQIKTALSTAISTSDAALVNLISGFNQDLQGQAGSTLSYKVVGTAPNRTLVVQWSGFKRFSQTSNINFQIRLNESSNTISFVYGTMTVSNSVSAQVGIKGVTTTDFRNRSSSTSWNSTSAGTTNSSTITLSSTVFPPSGLTFTFTPP